jgi:glutathione synthase/RimK-type ligase-like ATP-grasp enzyme
MLYIAPYKLGSESAKALALALNVKRITGEKLVASGSIVVNWGKSDLRTFGSGVAVYNKPEAVSRSLNKLETFKALDAANVPTLDWTEDRFVAMDWLNEGHHVYARTNVMSSQGRGIIVAGLEDALPYAPLYTKGFNKTHEYRVHVAFGQVIDFSKKKKRIGVDVSGFIKNSNNGWVYCRQDLVLPDAIKTACINAIKALGLDFGALDVLYKERDNEARIVEVNSAPGIEGTTLNAYVNIFRENM